MSAVAILSNLGILCFTTEIFDSSDTVHFMIFLIGGISLIAIKYAIIMVFNEIPYNIITVLSRHSHIASIYLANKCVKEVRLSEEKIDYSIQTYH